MIPLHQAKVAFVLGHELGCIALCGMVAEMLAMLRFQVSQHGSGSQAMSATRQERLFGRTFEQIEHSRRIGVLELLGLIDAATFDQFKKLSVIRNKYLHRLSQPHLEMARDAQEAYRLVVSLVVIVLGLAVDARGARINPEVLRYVKESQKVEPSA